jgi:8-oxo-dGTP pyrophosphatase MutT (NUDIX family)
MPGGGLEAGEDFADAAMREAKEESGCSFELGPCVWYRRHLGEWNGKAFNQYERFFVARVLDSTYAPPQQDGYISSHRWWSLGDILESTHTFAPGSIRRLLPPILDGVYPCQIIDSGV